MRSRARFQDLGVVEIPAMQDYYLGIVIVTILFVRIMRSRLSFLHASG